MPDGDEGRQQPGSQRCQRAAQHRQRRGEAAGKVGEATGGGFGADRRDHAAQHGHGGHAGGQWGHCGAGQGVGAAAGKADDAKPLCAERVGHLCRVGGPVGDRGVGVRVGHTRAGPLYDDDAQAELCGGAPAEHRELAPGARRAVAPQHHLARGVTELGVAKSATVGQVETAFRAWLVDAWHAEGMLHRVGQFHRFSKKSRRPGDRESQYWGT